MPHKILIVEDEDIIRRALHKLLNKHNFNVTEAASIPEAKQHDFNNFDLIISDLRLPGGQGTDLIPLAEQTPVLIMTSYSSTRSAVEAMKLGAVDYIAKPFDHKEMIKMVQNLLDVPNETDTQRLSAINSPDSNSDENSASNQAPKKLFDDYFVQFVQENEDTLNETELAKQLGISRKNLWERRQKLNIPRKK